MSNDLVSPDDLAYLPGAPFTEAETDAAAAAVRRAAGWHIAPERTETVELDVECYERWLRLPTAHLVSVEEIRNADTGEIVEASRYRVSHNLAQVKMRSWWPPGYEAVEVDMTHGYAETPPDLYPIIGEAAMLGRRDARVASVRIDDFSTQYRGDPTTATLRAALGDYALDGFALYGMGIA